MAVIEVGKLSMNEVDGNVLLIQDPGVGHEKVLFRYDPKNVIDRKRFFHYVEESDKFDAHQKMTIMFWMGYFHAHMGS